MAVLEKRVGLMLQNQDAYIKVAGGVKLDEPAIDLAIAVSIASSFRDQPTKPEDIFIGEVVGNNPVLIHRHLIRWHVI